MRNNPGQTALPIRPLGQLPARQRRGRLGHPLERPDLALPARRLPHPQPYRRALRRRLPAGRQPHPGLAGQLRRAWSRITTGSSISPASPGAPATSRARSSRAAIRWKARGRAEYPTPPLAQGLRAGAVHQGGHGGGAASVPAAVGQPLVGLHQPVRLQPGTLHVLRLLRAVRLCQLLQGQPADLRAAGAGARAELRGAHRQRGHARQPLGGRQARHRRHLRRPAGARSGSSRPTWCCCARSGCSTCG